MFTSKAGYRSKYEQKKIDIDDSKEGAISKWKLVIPYVVTISIFGLLIITLVKLQLVEGAKNDFLSGSNQKRTQVIKAPRGLIYDSNGKPLVYNIPTFRIMFDNSELLSGYAPGKEEEYQKKEEDYLEKLSGIIGVDKNVLVERYLAYTRTPDNQILRNQNITLVKGMSKEEIIALYPNLENLDGIYIQIDETRKYLYPELLAHTVGYTGDVTQEDLEKDKSLTYIDEVGKAGIESVYDDKLRGTNGTKVAEQDIDNNLVAEYTSEYAKRGNDVVLNIDLQVQQKLYDLLKKRIEDQGAYSGAVIVQDVKTGGIVALVSIPTYNTNELNNKYGEYLKDERNLFMNRALSGYPPGSTFKLFTASVLLEKGIINEDTQFTDRGVMQLGGGFVFQNYAKRSLGRINVKQALAVSSNLFFCNFSLNQDNQIFQEYADNFKLGEKTGIDITGESPGQLSSSRLKKELYNEAWYPGDNCNLAIGQGYTKVTPIQLVSITTALVNDGEYLKPRVAKAFIDNETGEVTELRREVDHNLGISQENIETIKEGMHLAAQGWSNGVPGTATGLMGRGDVAAKTGTAEATVKVNGKWKRDTLGWQTGFFPYEDPKYSFVVFVEGGGVGGSYQSAMMREFLDWFIDYKGINTN